MTFRARLLFLALVPWLTFSACTIRLINVPGEATGYSNVTDMDVTVETSGSITQYQFRVAPTDSPDGDCAANLGSYSPMLPKGDHLIKNLSSFADGPVRLCVRATYEYSVNGAPSTGTTTAQATWTKDTVPPGSFDITGPTGTQSINTPTVTWTAAEGASSYTVDITSDAACENIYKTYTGITGTSYEITGGIANGFWHVCVKAEDLASNKTAATNSGLLMTVDAPFHYLFATSTAFTGAEIGGLDGADDQCTLHAFIGNLIPDWNGVDRLYKAVLSTSDADANARVVLDRSIFNRNNTLVGFGTGIFTEALISPIAYDENGSLMGNAPAWSGSTALGVHSENSCSNWTSDAGLGTIGEVDKTDTTWISKEDASCGTSKHLYCVGPFAN